MRIKEVPSLPPVNLVCSKCDANLLTTAHTVYADLDGEPFKAYYCRLCVPGEDGLSWRDKNETDTP